MAAAVGVGEAGAQAVSICTYCGSLLRPKPAETMDAARQILADVAEEHMVTVEHLITGGRRRHLVLARRCAIKRLREEMKLPLKTIGFLLGGLDHATVIYHLRRDVA